MVASITICTFRPQTNSFCRSTRTLPLTAGEPANAKVREMALNIYNTFAATRCSVEGHAGQAKAVVFFHRCGHLSGAAHHHLRPKEVQQ